MVRKVRATAASLKSSKKSNKKVKSRPDDDDESIRDSGSEVGWNSDDDVRFGFRKKANEEEEEEEDDDDWDDDVEGGVLLSDLLGKHTTETATSTSAKPKKDQKAKTAAIPKVPARSSRNEVPEEVEDDSEGDFDEFDDDSNIASDDEDEDLVEDSDMVEDDDEEGDDDDDDDNDDDESGSAIEYDEDDDNEDEEASEEGGGEVEEADDQEEWGAAGSEDDYQQGSNDDEEEEFDDERHNRLLESVVKKLAPSSNKQQSSNNLYRNVAESQTFSQGKVTLGALMDALQDTRGISAVQAQLNSLDTARAAPQYVEKVVADRMERQATYKEKAADMDKWHDTVIANRTARQLDLAQDKKYVPTYKSLVRKFTPTTDFEKEIQMVVVSQKADDEGMMEREAAALKASQGDLSLEEIKQKQAELAKINRLMLYEQMKRHRINKIKSKAYRALRRREKKRDAARAQQSGEDEVADEDLDAEELEAMREKNAYNRIKERMDLKHKNSSKWAKMALAFGHTNEALRQAYHESVRLGHDLTSKMSEMVGNDDSEAEMERYEGEGSVAQQAQAELKDYLTSLDRSAAPEVSGKFSKLFAMDFMQKAADRQKEEAREQAKALLREIERMEDEADGGSGESDGEKAEMTAEKLAEQRARKQKAQKDVEAMLAGGSGMLLAKSGGAPAVAANPWVSAEAGSATNTTAVSTSTQSKKASKEAKKTSAIAAVATKADRKQSAKVSAASTAATAAIKAPIAVTEKAKSSSQKTKAAKKGTVPAVEENNDARNLDEEEPAEPAVPAKGRALVQRSQDELVAAAFAGPDFQAEFAASKQQQIDDELGIKQKQMQVLKDVKAGWGDWAGPGAMEISPKIVARRERALLQIQKENEVQRMARKDFHQQHVILSERRCKAAAKYKIADVPHPFSSREEYERSLQMPLGEEWNAAQVVSKVTAPEIKTRAGRIIEPIQLSKGKKRTEADTSAGTSGAKRPRKQ